MVMRSEQWKHLKSKWFAQELVPFQGQNKKATEWKPQSFALTRLLAMGWQFYKVTTVTSPEGVEKG